MTEGQAEFDYNAETLVTLDKFLSIERLAAYVNYARGDRWVAVRLYERNIEIAGSLYGVIQALEVTLRNAVHNAMSEHHGGPEWYETFDLHQSERTSVEEAKRFITLRPATVTPGRVVAELTFAFWVRLFSANYDRSLWAPHLHKVFPRDLRYRRRQLHGRLVELKTLRNRIAHHERLICGKQKVRQDYEDILTTIGWISPEIMNWVQSMNYCRECFTRPVPKKPKPSATQF